MTRQSDSINEYLLNPNGPKPYMSESERLLHEKYMSKDKIVLEYGSGGSTIYFSKFCKEIISLEEELIWYKLILNMIRRDKLNIKIYKVPKIGSNLTGNGPDIGIIKHKDLIKYIHLLPYKHYDIVIIDGPTSSRALCAEEILQFIDNNSIIFWHEYYHNIDEYSKNVVEKNYEILEKASGIGKYSSGDNLAVMRKKQ
jgi:hypothetical protein